LPAREPPPPPPFFFPWQYLSMPFHSILLLRLVVNACCLMAHSNIRAKLQQRGPHVPALRPDRRLYCVRAELLRHIPAHPGMLPDMPTNTRP
jgi:hypothetical protein